MPINIANAMLFAHVLTTEQIPQQTTSWVPVHLGIIMVVNMEIGLITPPVGLNLFVTSAVTGMPVHQVIRAAMPWLFILLTFLVVVTYVPIVSIGLPNFLGMK